VPHDTVRCFSATQEPFPGRHDKRFVARVREHLRGIRHIHYLSPSSRRLIPHRNVADAVGSCKKSGKIDATAKTPEEEAQRTTERLISGRWPHGLRSIFERAG
jgi:hypothetical protein